MFYSKLVWTSPDKAIQSKGWNGIFHFMFVKCASSLPMLDFFKPQKKLLLLLLSVQIKKELCWTWTSEQERSIFNKVFKKKFSSVVISIFPNFQCNTKKKANFPSLPFNLIDIPPDYINFKIFLNKQNDFQNFSLFNDQNLNKKKIFDVYIFYVCKSKYYQIKPRPQKHIL